MDVVRRRCQAAKDKYTKRGYNVITPVEIVTDSSTPYSACIGKCVEALMECQAAVFLQDWEQSRGCQVERSVCQVYSITTVLDHQL